MTLEPDWQTDDGAVQLYRGDCLEVMPRLEEAVDAIICDLPYGTTACAWDTVIPFAPLWEAYKRVIKPKGAIVLFGSQPFTSVLVMSNPSWFRHGFCWDKTVSGCFTQAKVMPMKTHEDLCVFSASKGNPKYYPQMVKAEKVNYLGGDLYSQVAGVRVKRNIDKLPVGKPYTHRYPNTVLCFSLRKDVSRGLHPTQKPVALLEYLIRTYTNEGETVLDNTFGSGTTAVACINTGRRFIGIERDPAYFDVAVNRCKEALGTVGLFASIVSS